MATCTTRCSSRTCSGAVTASLPRRSQLRHALPPSARCEASSRPVPATADTASSSISYKHVMVAILDQSAYLSAGSRQAINSAAGLARDNGGKLTVLLVDEHGVPVQDAEVRLRTLDWHLKESGYPEYELVERAVESKSSVLIGDVADELEADLMVLSCDAVHSKRVDANLLAEFVPCPVLMLP